MNTAMMNRISNNSEKKALTMKQGFVLTYTFGIEQKIDVEII